MKVKDVVVVKVWWIIWIPCFDEVKTWSSSDEEFPVTQCILKFEGSVHVVVSYIITWQYFHWWWFQEWRWRWCTFNKVKVKKVKIGIVLRSCYIVRFMIIWYHWRRVWTIEVYYKSWSLFYNSWSLSDFWLNENVDLMSVKVNDP